MHLVAFQSRLANSRPHTLTRYLALCLIALLHSALSGAQTPDYAEPNPLTGTVYERGTKRVLFKFVRKAAQTGEVVQVMREFTRPDGSIAAQERVIYSRGQLVSFRSEELQIHSRAGVTVLCEKTAGKASLQFELMREAGTRKSNTETVQPDTLIGDMIPYFVTAHWDELMKGEPVKFRFIAESRLETIGFKLVKENDTKRGDIPVVRIRMEPASLLIAQIVDPIYFTVEKTGAHRILEYDGRTTPMIRVGNKWKDLDALTVYDWPTNAPAATP